MKPIFRWLLCWMASDSVEWLLKIIQIILLLRLHTTGSDVINAHCDKRKLQMEAFLARSYGRCPAISLYIHDVNVSFLLTQPFP